MEPPAATALEMPEGSGAAAAGSDATPTEDSNSGWLEGLPSWLRLGLGLRGRAEFDLDAEPERAGRAYLNRLRLQVEVRPVRWMSLYLEGQDARAYSLNSGQDVDGRRNSFDVRQGYVEFGRSEQGFQVRAGRQELSVGDERLIGADSYWDPFGQAFDAVRVSYDREWGTVQAFSGFRVEPGRRHPDAGDRGSRIAGLTAQFKTRAGDGVVEPYLLWKRGADTRDLLERPGHRDVATPGVWAEGSLPRSFDYNVEVAFQRGHVVGDAVGAWAGHWEIGWKPLGQESGPRVGFEYNHASGDSDPADGRHGSFDDLYPAGFNSYGIPDPFAWRNIRYPGVCVEIPLTRRWTGHGGWRSYRLATVQDGLYGGGDIFLARNPDAGSASIGSQVFLSVDYAPSRWWHVHAGYGHLFPGGFLQQCGCAPPAATLYILSSYAF